MPETMLGCVLNVLKKNHVKSGFNVVALLKQPLQRSMKLICGFLS